MLSTIFLGSNNDFDRLLVHWLAQRTELRGVVWTTTTAWQRTLHGRIAFARRRASRIGPLKALDEAAFYLVYHGLQKDADHAELVRRVIGPYREEHGDLRWRGDAISAADVNSGDVLEFVQRHGPDLALALCVNHRFGEEIRAIPRYGVFLWHEGITPEYKGLYSPFWATHNLDFERVGYTLLRMNADYDAGDVFVQGPARDVEPTRHGHLYMGHKAIWDSLPEVERFLGELERDQAKPLERADAQAGMYTYPGLSDLIRQRRRLRRARAS